MWNSSSSWATNPAAPSPPPPKPSTAARSPTAWSASSWRSGRNDRPGYERQHVIEIVIQIKHRLSALQERIADGRVGIVGLRYLLSDGSTEQVIADGVE